MPSLRQEVHEFVRATETLLSPASLDAPLWKEEIRIVEFYARQSDRLAPPRVLHPRMDSSPRAT